MKRLMTLVMGLMLLPAQTMSATIHVPADQPTIQAGIDAAVDGDTVLVAAGVFKEDTLTISNKHLTIRGTFSPDTTFFDGRMVVDNSNIAIRTIAFTHSSTLTESGGVFYGILCDLDADSIVVRESTAKRGGAFCIDNGGRIALSRSRINGFVSCYYACTWGERVGGAIFACARQFFLTDCNVSGYANYEPRDGRAAGGALYLNCDTVAICNSDVSGFARAWTGGANIAEGGAIRCSALTFRSSGNVFSGYARADGEKVNPMSYAYGDARGGALFLDVQDGYITGDRYRQCHCAASYSTTPGHEGGAKAFGGAIYATGTGIVKMSNVAFDTTFVHIADSSDSLQIALGGAVYADCQTTVECGTFRSVTPDSVFGAQLVPCNTPSNRIWYVSAAGPLCPEDGSPYLPMHSIQAAINGAGDGDTVIVLPGIYYESDVNLSGKAILLSSIYLLDPDTVNVATTILADSAANWHFSSYPRLKCISGEDARTVINGFTLQGKCGGIDLLNSSPTITNNRFCSVKRAIVCSWGGAGIYAVNSSSIIDGNRFQCKIDGCGAGIYATGSALGISRCEFLNCEAYGEAAGIFLDGSATIRSCVFRGNSSGGGITIDAISNGLIQIDSCRFEDNGTGSVVRSADRVIISNSVFRNSGPPGESIVAARFSTGQFLSDSISGFYMGIDAQGWEGNATVASSVIAGNVIGIHTIGDTVSVTNSIVSDNSEYGLYAVSGTYVVDSCFLLRNGIGIHSYYGASGLKVSRSLFLDHIQYAIKIEESLNSAEISNNTFVGGKRGLFFNKFCTVENNIIVTDSVGISLSTELELDTPIVRFNDIRSAARIESPYAFYGDSTWSVNTSGVPCDSLQNIFRDPEFTDAEAGDYSLQPASPCIDAGNPDPAFNDPDGSRNDIGAFYHTNTTPTVPTLTEPPNTTIIPLTTLLPQFIWSTSVDPDPNDTVTYLLAMALDSNFTFAQQIPSLIDTSYTPSADLEWGRRYWWKVKASDRVGAEVWSPQTFTFRTVTLGDSDNDAMVTVADVVFLIDYIFLGGHAPVAPMTADPNCDGHINIGDAVYLVSYVFSHGPAPCDDF